MAKAGGPGFYLAELAEDRASAKALPCIDESRGEGSIDFASAKASPLEMPAGGGASALEDCPKDGECTLFL